jgi:hypothetical protein
MTFMVFLLEESQSNQPKIIISPASGNRLQGGDGAFFLAGGV